jgi:hypothetical protein
VPSLILDTRKVVSLKLTAPLQSAVHYGVFELRVYL